MSLERKMLNLAKRLAREIGLAGIVAGVPMLTGCGDVPDFEDVNYTIERINIEKVVRGEYKFKIYFVDETGEVKEQEYFDTGLPPNWVGKITLPAVRGEDKGKFKGLGKDSNHVRLFKDLDNGQAYAQVIRYKGRTKQNSGIDSYYAEIHIPKGGRVASSNEPIWEGNFPKIELK